VRFNLVIKCRVCFPAVAAAPPHTHTHTAAELIMLKTSDAGPEGGI
jgi:hypothetical protein